MLGVASNRELDTCHPKLQRLIREVDRRLSARAVLDLVVMCGHRGELEQNAAYASERSTKQWPYSLHNRLPSPAVDVAPHPIDWRDKARFARLAGYIEAVAEDMGIQIRWGGDWNQNGRTVDERLVDMPHLELTELERNRP